MNKLILTVILTMLSSDVLALEEKPVNDIDMFVPIIFIIPLTLLLYAVFMHYKSKKRVNVKTSYASTNVIIDKDKYKPSNSEINKKTNNGVLDSISDIDITPSNTTKLVSAIAIDDIISDGGEMSGGGSSLDFDFDWD